MSGDRANGAAHGRPWTSLVAAVRGRGGAGRWLLALLAVYACAQAVFLLTTVAAASVPNEAIVTNLDRDAGQGLWSAIDYPRDGVGHSTERFPFAGVTDAFTECIALTIGLQSGQDPAPLLAALDGSHLGTCSSAVPSVAALAQGGQPEAEFTYNRYWNGYAVITRPLLALGGVGAVRLAVGAVFLLGIVAAACTIARRVSPWAALAVLAPVLASTNLVTQPLGGMSHALSFGVLCLGVAAAVRFALEPLPSLIVVAALAGATFNFVDFLLNPPIAWALFVFAAAATRWVQKGSSVRGLWLATGCAAIGWIGGYALTWLTRWLLALAAFGESAWQEIVGVVSNRLQGQYEGLVVPGFLQTTGRNALFWLTTIPVSRAVAIACALVALICLILVLVARRWQALHVGVVLAAPALIVVLWLELLSNHSQIHVFFVYRAIPVALGIVAAASLVACASAAGRHRSGAEVRQGE